MSGHGSGSGETGLERSCVETASGWIRQSAVTDGIELFEARLRGHPYRKHRHDTYAISLTGSGVLTFDYRGASHTSLPGQVVVLHPDEQHDGHAGSDDAFAYRQLYVEPALIFAAARALYGRPTPLPFARDPVLSSPALAAAIRMAFQESREPLATDDLVLRLAEGLLQATTVTTEPPRLRRVDTAAIERARQFLDAEPARVVRSWELEAVTGLSRYDFSRQFRAALGTSPYRYSLMRRLDHARGQLARHLPVVQVALDAGFADQAHFTRHFAAAYGMTPAHYRALSLDFTPGPPPAAFDERPNLPYRLRTQRGRWLMGHGVIRR